MALSICRVLHLANKKRPRDPSDGRRAGCLIFDKAGFTMNWFDGASLSSVVFDKDLAKYKVAFANCIRHAANQPPAVVLVETHKRTIYI